MDGIGRTTIDGRRDACILQVTRDREVCHPWLPIPAKARYFGKIWNISIAHNYFLN